MTSMRTDDLIRALVADHAARVRSPTVSLAVAVSIGIAVAATLFQMELGVRPDFAAAMHQGRFVLKFVVTLTLAISAAALVLRLARPGAAIAHWLPFLAVGPALLAAGIAVELATVPAAQWQARMIGSNSMICLTAVPLLALIPLLAALFALRDGAPTRPALTGAVAGLLAGGLGAALYAAHCTDDSPLFVALWYGLAIGAVTVLGGILGARILRW
jgi:hypothetical protein